MRIRTTRLHVDALLLSELTALRGVVRGRVVELVQAVLRNAQELHSGVVLRLHRGVLRVLSLTGLRRLGDRLVQSNNAVAQGLDIVLKRSNALLHLRNRGLQTRDLALQLALLVLRGVELRLAPLLLLLVLLLLLLQQDNHVIDHLDDLLETSLLTHQRELDHAELRRVLLVLQVRERREGLVAHVAVRLRHLEQARRRKGLLEQVQGIIIVQDLDGLRNRNRLLRAARLALLVVILRRGAALLQLRHELLVLAQGILRILQAVLLHLSLDRLRGRLDLLLLRGHQRVEFRLRGVLRLGSVSELLLHVLQKLLQNAHDLARRRRVARRRRRELRQHVASVAVQRVARENKLAKRTSSVALQEATSHALGDRVDRLLARRDVSLRLRRLVNERRVLLLALRRRGGDRRLRILTVLLVLSEVRLELRLRAERLLDRGLDLRDLRLQRRNAIRQLLAVRLAVAHVLLVHLLVLLTILLDLLRHHLKEVHDAADRVLRHLFLAADCSCLYSCQTEQESQDAHVCWLRCRYTSASKIGLS